MKIERTNVTPIDDELVKLLERFRKRRGFNAATCFQAKSIVLNRYLRQNGLRGVVFGISGGIDSAVLCGLLARAAKEPGSPLQRVVALSLPLFVDQGTTNQARATERGALIAHYFQVEHHSHDLAASFRELRTVTSTNMGISSDPWADGQLVSNIRTPALYYAATLLSKSGVPSVVCGTTNRDEGAYLGFFGKASDAMVDLQLLSDLHKSEIYQLAAYLGVPAEIVSAEPSGDVYDGATHLQMIGAPYDFVELFLSIKSLSQVEQQRLVELLRNGAEPRNSSSDGTAEPEILHDAKAYSDSNGRQPGAYSNASIDTFGAVLDLLHQTAREQFSLWSARLEQLHSYNRHKYRAGSQAIHFDLYPRAVPGGWRTEHLETAAPTLTRNFVGEFSFSNDLLSKLAGQPETCPNRTPLGDAHESAFLLDGVLRPEECTWILDEIASARRIPVGNNGMLKDYKAGQQIGSYRATAYSEAVAELLWERIAPSMNPLRIADTLTSTDVGSTPVWRAVGINPALRCIWYEQGGRLVPHYDSGFDFKDCKRYTLMSLVVYLTAAHAADGGRTRFLLDPQRLLPRTERTFEDWNRAAREDEVLDTVTPTPGRALIFDHRLLHDAEPWMGGTSPRVIIRTDIVFERCAPQATLYDTEQSIAERIREQDLAPRTGASHVAIPHQPQGPALRRDRITIDPFYGDLLRNGFSESELLAAGWFDDGLTLDPRSHPASDPNFLCTPLHTIRRRLEQYREARSLNVLIATGAFCPIHSGHITMMESARAALEARGDAVLGGYIAPDHDHYVLRKTAGKGPTAAERVELCKTAVKESPWLMVDPWPALYAPTALNFTDVVARLEIYLGRHLRSIRPVKIWFVCGGDNQHLATAFLRRGHCIVVDRPDPQNFQRSPDAQTSHRQHCDRILLAPPLQSNATSSRSIRAGDHSGSLPELSKPWQSWMENGVLGAPLPSHICLRYEGDWALEPWTAKNSIETLRKSYERFAQELESLLHSKFSPKSAAYGAPTICRAELSTQQRLLREHLGQSPSISLDPCIPGSANLEISRVFEIADSFRQEDYQARPGSPSLELQVERIPPGAYTIVDDDIVTGGTIRAAQSHLSPRTRVQRELGANALPGVLPFDIHSVQPQRIEVGDFRDFLVGSREGGLVVRLPTGTLARVPYLAPYVDLSARCKLPPQQILEISKAVWEFNHAFFISLPTPLLVADLAPATRALLLYVGFLASSKASEVCAWHLRALDESYASKA